jgi:hypothetical protein
MYRRKRRLVEMRVFHSKRLVDRSMLLAAVECIKVLLVVVVLVVEHLVMAVLVVQYLMMAVLVVEYLVVQLFSSSKHNSVAIIYNVY